MRSVLNNNKTAQPIAIHSGSLGSESSKDGSAINNNTNGIINRMNRNQPVPDMLLYNLFINVC